MRSPILLSFHRVPERPVRSSWGRALAFPPSNTAGRSSRTYVIVQISRRTTVRREEKSKMADIAGFGCGCGCGAVRGVVLGCCGLGCPMEGEGRGVLC